MKHDYFTNYSKVTLFGIIFLFSIVSQSQTTIPFDLGLGDNAQLGTTANISGFNFTISGNLTAGDDITFDNGSGSPNGSNSLYDDNLDIGGITQWTIKSIDGSEFQLISIYLQDAGVASPNGTISAFKDGVQIGTTDAIDFNGTKTLSSNPDYNNIDEFRINAADINFYMDNLTYNTPVLSTKDIVKETITTFYNSDNNTLQIKGINSSEVLLNLFSIEGRQLTSLAFSTNTNSELSLPNLSAGIYIIRLQTNQSNYSKKIIVH